MEKIRDKIKQYNSLIDHLKGDEEHVVKIKDRFDQGRAIEAGCTINLLIKLLMDIDSLNHQNKM